MKDDVVRARINSEVKARAAQVLAACGLEHSDVIRMLYQQIVLRGGVPFDIRAEPEPSMAELRLLKRQSQKRDRRIASSVDVSEGQMLLVPPDRLRGAKVHWPEASLA